MEVQFYATGSLYVSSATTLDERIARIDAIIDALLLLQVDAVGKSDISEYMLDDGQTKIATTYRSASDISASIMAYEKIKNYYNNQKRGRVTRLIDARNLPGRR